LLPFYYFGAALRYPSLGVAFVTAAPGRVNQDLLRIANEYLGAAEYSDGMLVQKCNSVNNCPSTLYKHPPS
jgi:hypothetical protein